MLIAVFELDLKFHTQQAKIWKDAFTLLLLAGAHFSTATISF